MDKWQIAQINVGRLLAPQGHPQVAGFFEKLDEINALADASPGFVWRLQGEGNNATDLRPTPDPMFIVNMSVWEDADSLFEFVYRSAHTPSMANRRSYFERFEGAYQALWWVRAKHRPTVDEGLARLWMLDRYGPSPNAFSFKARYPAPNEMGLPTDMKPDPWCVGWA